MADINKNLKSICSFYASVAPGHNVTTKPRPKN